MKQPTATYSLGLLIVAALLIGFCLERLALSPQRAGGAAMPALAQGGTLSLSLPSALAPGPDGLVTAPVHLAAAGASVSSLLFSLDIDQSCLVFNPADANRDGQLDAVKTFTPPGFISSISYDALDSDGELDVIIADYSPPYAALPDGVLLTLRLGIACRPEGSNSLSLPLPFSLAPAASFSSPSGGALAGVTVDGSVLVTASTVLPTPGPTATATPVTGPGTPTPAASPTPGQTIPPPDRSDEDGDGVYSQEEGNFDWDGDGVANLLDSDDDGDGVPTLLEGRGDADGNGLPNFLDLDSNDNGVVDAVEAGPDPLHPLDANHNGRWDYLELAGKPLYLPLIQRGGAE